MSTPPISSVHLAQTPAMTLAWKDLVKYSSSAVAVFDDQFKCLYHSDSWHQIGFGSQHSVGKYFFDIFPQAELVWADLLAQCQGGESMKGDPHRFVFSDGRILWLACEARPWKKENGGIAGVLITLHDHTKEFVARNQYSGEYFQLAEACKLGMLAYWEWKAGHGMLNFSSQLPLIYNLDPEDVQIRSFPEIVASMVVPEDVDRFMEVRNLVYTEQKPQDLLYRIRTPDNQIRHIRTTYQLFEQDPDDGALLIKGITQDITSLNQTQQRIDGSEQAFRHVMAKGGIAMLLLDVDLTCIGMSPVLSNMLGQIPYADRQVPFLSLMHPVDRLDKDTVLTELITNLKDSITVEKRIRHAEGYYLSLEFTFTVVRNEEGAVRMLVGHVNNQTLQREQVTKMAFDNEELERLVLTRTRALEEANTNLQMSNDQLERFAHTIAHDLRAPIRHMQGYAEVLTEDYAQLLPETAQKFLGYIQKAGDKLGTMVDQLLQFAKDSNHPLMLEWVDLSKLIDELKELLLTDTLHADTIEWVLDIKARVWGDPYLIRVIMQNLMSNAMKFSSNQTNSTIIIKAFYDETGTTIEVEDHGIGFDMQYYEKLFLIFERLTGQPHFPGTGIGLANVKKAVDRHKGRVWAESKIGEGATFWVSLPGQ